MDLVVPFIAPYFSMAIFAYSEQVGWNLQLSLVLKWGDMCFW